MIIKCTDVYKWNGEKTDLLRKMKELNRRLEEVNDDV